MVKMSFTNNQTAFAYALYMMMGSYFDKAVCQSPKLEKDMRLQYNEMKDEKQFAMEDICIRYMDKLERKLPKECLASEVDAFLSKERNGKIRVTFKGEGFTLQFRPTYAGCKASEMGMTFRVKKEGVPLEKAA